MPNMTRQRTGYAWLVIRQRSECWVTQSPTLLLWHEQPQALPRPGKRCRLLVPGMYEPCPRMTRPTSSRQRLREMMKISGSLTPAQASCSNSETTISPSAGHHFVVALPSTSNQLERSSTDAIGPVSTFPAACTIWLSYAIRFAMPNIGSWHRLCTSSGRPTSMLHVFNWLK
jgi:hypothetical protein